MNSFQQIVVKALMLNYYFHFLFDLSIIFKSIQLIEESVHKILFLN